MPDRALLSVAEAAERVGTSMQAIDRGRPSLKIMPNWALKPMAAAARSRANLPVKSLPERI